MSPGKGNAWARELWRRTTVALNRSVARHRPATAPGARVSFGKVAEFQRRGVVHYHAVLRLDGMDESDRDAIIGPPEWAMNPFAARSNGFICSIMPP